jgi:hypothetical protein
MSDTNSNNLPSSATADTKKPISPDIELHIIKQITPLTNQMHNLNSTLNSTLITDYCTKKEHKDDIKVLKDDITKINDELKKIPNEYIQWKGIPVRIICVLVGVICFLVTYLLVYERNRIQAEITGLKDKAVSCPKVQIVGIDNLFQRPHCQP